MRTLQQVRGVQSGRRHRIRGLHAAHQLQLTRFAHKDPAIQRVLARVDKGPVAVDVLDLALLLLIGVLAWLQRINEWKMKQRSWGM